MQENTAPLHSQRESNIELLRIIAMVLVLVVHACLAVGNPEPREIFTDPAHCIANLSVQGVAIICVDIFVLISGWFGINFRWKHLVAFIFQVIFIELVVIALVHLSGLSHGISFRQIINHLAIADGFYWFVRAYLLLYILSPVLNAFASKCTKRQMEYFLILFFAFEFLYGFFLRIGNFDDGYSAMSFIGLYMLARYMRRYPSRITQMNKSKDMLAFIILTVVNICGMLLLNALGHSPERLLSYCSPIIILASVFIFLFFTKLKFHSRAINWVAASCFAVYLVHCSDDFINIYLDQIRHWFEVNPTWLFTLKTVLWIAAIFAVSILIDKIRIALRKRIAQRWQKS